MRLTRAKLRRLVIEAVSDVEAAEITSALKQAGGAADKEVIDKALAAAKEKEADEEEEVSDDDLAAIGVGKLEDGDYYLNPANESRVRRMILDVLLEGKKGEEPAHFGSGKNVTVFGYKTKHFDICLSATNLFNDLKKQLNAKGVSLDGVEKMVKKAARISDQIFGLEKRVVKKGTATKKECDRARELNAELKDCLKHVLGSDTNSRLNYMPMHIREITKRKEK